MDGLGSGPDGRLEDEVSSNRTLCVTLAALAMAAGAVGTADAQYRDDWTLAGTVGYYDPDPDLIDSQTSFGLSLGHMVGDRWGYQLSASYVDPDQVVQPGIAELEWDATFVDLAFHWVFGKGDLLVPSVFVGPGWAFVGGRLETSDQGGGTSQELLSDDSFTVNFGAAVRIDLGEQFFVWPQARWRYFEARDDDELDLEGLVAFGLKF